MVDRFGDKERLSNLPLLSVLAVGYVGVRC